MALAMSSRTLMSISLRWPEGRTRIASGNRRSGPPRYLERWRAESHPRGESAPSRGLDRSVEDGRLIGRQACHELLVAVDLEPRVDGLEVVLQGVRRDVEPVCDLGVRQAPSTQQRDLLLPRR